MDFKHPDIDIFYKSFLRDMANTENFKIRDANDVKIKSILNIDIYTKATRFLEGAVKHIVYNCCIIRDDSAEEITTLISKLKKLNNPKYEKIKQLLLDELNFDIDDGLRNNAFQGNDKGRLNEIVNNRHRNVHATEDVSEWYNANVKDMSSFVVEFESLIKIMKYIDSITYNATTQQFSCDIA